MAGFFDDFHSRVQGYHEPQPSLLEYGISNAVGEIEFSKILEALRNGRKASLQNLDDDLIYLEANNRLFSLIPALRELFDDLKIAHIIRDGRDYVRSGLSRPLDFDYWYSPDDPFAHNNLRMKATMFPDDLWRNRWKYMTPFEKIAWRWMKKDSFIRQSVPTADDAETIKFEQIFNESEGYPGLKKLKDVLDLEDPQLDSKDVQERLQQPSNESKEYNIPHWTNWNQDRRNAFRNIAGDYLAQYDYKW